MLRLKRLPDACQHTLEIPQEELHFKPEHSIPGPLKRRIAARVSAPTLSMVAAINFNDELLHWSTEIRDEAAEERHLATENNAEPPPANALPEKLLRRRERSTHAASALSNELTTPGVAAVKQGLVVGSSHAYQGAGGVTARRRVATGISGAGASRAPSRTTRADNKPELHQADDVSSPSK